MDKTIKTEIDTLSKNEYRCYQDYIFLESEITPSMIDGRVDINYEAMIPMVQAYTHVMQYIPQQNHNGLRVIVDRSNT